MKFKRQRSQEVGVDLTPLIDVVFLLLIFFMVSTTFTRESHLQVELPEASAEPAAPSEVWQIDVVINAEGQYFLNDRPLVNNRRETLERGVSELAEGENYFPPRSWHPINGNHIFVATPPPAPLLRCSGLS